MLADDTFEISVIATSFLGVYKSWTETINVEKGVVAMPLIAGPVYRQVTGRTTRIIAEVAPAPCGINEGVVDYFWTSTGTDVFKGTTNTKQT